MHKIFANSFWLLLDKLSKLFIGLIVIAKVAQYLGPAKFGIWNYCIALTTIVGVLATLGLEKIVIKELVNDPGGKREIITSSIFLRILAGFLSLIICMGIVYFGKERNETYLYCTFILSLNLLLQSFDVYDYYYQSQYLNKNTVIPRVAVFIVFSVIRIIFIHYNFQLMDFAWLSFWELFFTYLIIVIIYLYNHDGDFIFFGNLSYKRSVNLMKQSWPLIFTGLAILVYMKIDQVMLDMLSTAEQLGQYVAAVRLSELCYAIPMVIATAFLPRLIEIKKSNEDEYHFKIEAWLRISLWFSIAISICITIFSPALIHTLYGDQYKLASNILRIHIWAALPVFVGIVISQYLIIEGKIKLNLYATIIAAFLNVVLNIFFIPVWGSLGAAVTNFISQLSVLIIMIFLYKSKNLFPIKFFNPAYIIKDIYYLKTSLKAMHKKIA